jgi:hypothetical protein
MFQVTIVAKLADLHKLLTIGATIFLEFLWILNNRTQKTSPQLLRLGLGGHRRHVLSLTLLESRVKSMDNHFDVIILGTGLTESIIAA